MCPIGFSLRSMMCAVPVAVALAAAAAPTVAAEVDPAFTVASYGPVGGQSHTLGFSPWVARSESGDFVVVYQDATYKARLYRADGTAKGPAMPIQTGQAMTSLVMAPSGAFAVGYFAGIGTQLRAKIQRYAPDGSAQGGPIDAGPFPVVYGSKVIVLSSGPFLAMDHDGNIAVAWSTQTTRALSLRTFTQSSKTYAATYGSDGTVIKAATVVDSVPTKVITPDQGTGYNNHMLEGVARDAGGDLALVLGLDWDEHDRAAQTGVLRLTAGLESKAPLQTVSEVQEFSAVAMDAPGNYAVGWRDPADNTVHVSRFDADGNALGVIGPIGTPEIAPSLVETPSVLMTPSGNLAVTWGRQVPSGNAGFTTEVKYSQYFWPDGSANGDAFVVDADPGNVTNAQSSSGIDASGNVVRVWQASGIQFLSQSILGRQTHP